MREWLSNRLAVALGPHTFGLPYRFGEIDYEIDSERVAGRVDADHGRFEFNGKPALDLLPAEPDSLDEFLLERYTAFAAAKGSRKYFRIWHPPWQVATNGTIEITDQSLLDAIDESWTHEATAIGDHVTPGVSNVWMGRPHVLD